jgi:ATP-binding cassette subfamily F protein 3
MSLVRAKNIYKSYNEHPVLADVSFSLEPGQKVALVGPNGTGKTTLLKIIAGLEEMEKGSLQFAKNLRIGYLAQDTSLAGQETVAEYLRGRQERGEPDHHWQVMLAGFGLGDDTHGRPLQELSSGQKSKVALAGILLRGVDLLLLDEPTNNLDLPALIWLEDFLLKSEASALVVSHDRRFLDRVVRKIFELDWETRGLKISGGSYSDYLMMEVKRLNRRKEEYRLQQEEIARLKSAVVEKREDAEAGARFVGTDNDKLIRGFFRDRAKGSARTATVINRRIKRIKRVDDPEEREPLVLEVAADRGTGELDLAAQKVLAGYPDGFKLGPVTLDIRFGTRVGIMGLNGSGKSTLLKTLTGELAPLAGTVSVGSGVRFGNMMQEHESLNREQTPLEFLQAKTELRVQDIFNLLVKFNFDEPQIKAAIGTLSPGGRARLLLALFSAQGVNTLALDEPTNHLDIDAQAALEAMLARYEGTVLLVSHDRYFIEQAKLDYVYVLEDNTLHKISDYAEYVAKAEERAKRLLRLL